MEDNTMANDFDDCVVTFEDVERDLEQVELQLARQLNVPRGRSIRRMLLGLSAQRKLVEDELVARWHQLYLTYADFVQWQEHSSPPEAEWGNPQPQPKVDQPEPKAADAAFAALWLTDGGAAWLSTTSRKGTLSGSFPA
ncbi:MAG TPA: hypothetical protein VGM56_08370 [Byssovorax sp.]|jgi:hypothetical protein